MCMCVYITYICIYICVYLYIQCIILYIDIQYVCVLSRETIPMRDKEGLQDYRWV